MAFGHPTIIPGYRSDPNDGAGDLGDLDDAAATMLSLGASSGDGAPPRGGDKGGKGRGAKGGGRAVGARGEARRQAAALRGARVRKRAARVPLGEVEPSEAAPEARAAARGGGKGAGRWSRLPRGRLAGRGRGRVHLTLEAARPTRMHRPGRRPWRRHVPTGSTSMWAQLVVTLVLPTLLVPL
jgi:hypothetical protein